LTVLYGFFFVQIWKQIVSVEAPYPIPAEIRVRPARDTRREAILDVSKDVFLNEGYAAASMSSIAARLGGSKGTLYNYFKSKEDLFEAYVRRECLSNSDEMMSLLSDSGEPKRVLRTWGLRYLANITSDMKLRAFRMIAAEAERWPEIGRIYYESGPQRGREVLADFLRKASERGELKIKDPMQAAHHFVALCNGRFIYARACNAVPVPTAEEIEAEVDAAIAVFFSAYGNQA
jgi:AcrR family transcriptional regulator